MKDWIKMCPTPVSDISSRIVTTHGDFHVKNLVLNSEHKLKAVDYEFSCVSSAIFDLSYAMALWMRGADTKRRFIKTYL